jgi:hypothetical protein
MEGNANDFIFFCLELQAGGAYRFCPGKEASQKVHGTYCTVCLVSHTDIPTHAC